MKIDALRVSHTDVTQERKAPVTLIPGNNAETFSNRYSNHFLTKP